MIYHVDAKLFYDVEAKNEDEASDMIFDFLHDLELPEGITLVDSETEVDPA